LKTEKRLTGLSSSAYEPQITDASLCGLWRRGVELQALKAYYQALLALGIAYIQVPWDAVTPLATLVEPERTVLSVPQGGMDVPQGYAGYLSVEPIMSGHAICECAWDDDSPWFAHETRRIADQGVFFADYAAAFRQMADTHCGFCPRGAGDFGTALSVEWLLAGGCRLTAAFMGAGGCAPLEEVLAALHVVGMLPPSVQLEKLPDVAESYRRLTKTQTPANKAVIGSALFDVESGVHVDGIAKNRQCYEPFAPELVGASRHIVVGKHSGKQALKIKLDELGLHGMYDLDRLLHLVREQSMCGGGLDDHAFAALAKKAAGGDAA